GLIEHLPGVVPLHRSPFVSGARFLAEDYSERCRARPYVATSAASRKRLARPHIAGGVVDVFDGFGLLQRIRRRQGDGLAATDAIGEMLGFELILIHGIEALLGRLVAHFD